VNQPHHDRRLLEPVRQVQRHRDRVDRQVLVDLDPVLIAVHLQLVEVDQVDLVALVVVRVEPAVPVEPVAQVVPVAVLVFLVAPVVEETHAVVTHAAQQLVPLVAPVVVPQEGANQRSSDVKSLMICKRHPLVASLPLVVRVKQFA
jgi:hypothetical protein